MNHSYRTTRYFSALLGLILGFSSVFAQEDPRLWEEDGVAVRQGSHHEWHRESVVHENGSTCVVWSDARTGQHLVYFQIINSDGTLLVETQGRQALQSDFHCMDPVVTAVSDGWVIGWLSQSTWADEGYYEARSIGAQKISLNGVLQWSEAGVEVYRNDDLDYFVMEVSLDIVTDGNGGAILAWEEGRDGSIDISAARVNAAGQLPWNDIVWVTDVDDSQDGMHAVSDGQGNMIVAWNDRRTPGDSDIYAAKIMTDGTLPWGEGLNGIPICTAEYAQSSVRLCSDYTNGGAYLIWDDSRLSASDFNLYAQRVNGDGSILWQENGILLCGAPDKQLRPYIASSFNGDSQDGAVAVWQDIRANGFISEVYAQKVSPDGTMLWTADGVLVCGNAGPNTTGETRDNARIISDHAGGAYFCWDDTRDSEGNIRFYDLYAARLNANGENLWSECGELVQGGDLAQWKAVMTYNATNSAVDVVFLDDSHGSSIVKHQRLNASDGSHLLETVNIILESLDGDAVQPTVLQLSDGRAAIVWRDDRFGNAGTALFYQIVNSDGSFVLPNSMMVASDNTGFSRYNQKVPALASDGSDGFFVAFADNRGEAMRIRLSRINSEGNLVSDPAGVIVFDYVLDQLNPRICPDGNGGCYVAWQGNDFSFTLDIYVQHFDQDCEALWDAPIQLTNDGSYDDYIRDIVPSERCCILIWDTWLEDYRDVFSARVCSDGEVDWTQTVCDADNHQNNPDVIEDGLGGVIIAWEDSRSLETGQDIYAQYLNVNGEPLWQDNGIPILEETGPQFRPDLVYSPANGLYVVWMDFRNDVHTDLYAQKIDLSGNLLWDPSGLLLCGEENDQDRAKVSLNDDGGIFVVWKDNRGFYADIYGTNLLPDGQTTNEWWVEGSGGIICSAHNDQSTPVLAPMSESQNLIVWSDRRASTAPVVLDIYMQSVNVSTISSTPLPLKSTVETFALHQNYPNPFNPSTTITFSIPNAGQTSLIVYDLLGRSVETLMDKPLTADNYHIQWNANALPSGVYFYRLTSGEFSDVKKTVLLK